MQLNKVDLFDSELLNGKDRSSYDQNNGHFASMLLYKRFGSIGLGVFYIALSYTPCIAVIRKLAENIFIDFVFTDVLFNF